MPMKIAVLGSGCSNCKRLYEITQKAVEELGLSIQVEYITGDEGLKKIMELGLMQSPVLTIDDEAVMVGFIDDTEKIKEIINEKLG